MRLLSFTILLLGISFSSFQPIKKEVSNNTEWKRKYNKNGMTIYTRTASDGLKEFKAIMELNTKLSTAVAVLSDYQNHPKWMDSVMKTELVQKVNNQNLYLYYVIDVPWPLSNRDIVSNYSFKQSKTGVTMYMKSAPTKKAKTKCVRMYTADGFWKLIPQANGKIKLIYQYKGDPNGIPSKIVEMFLIDGPRKTLMNLKQQVTLDKYKNAKVGWLK